MSIDNFVDLHIHSNCSDGEREVDDLLASARELGLRAVGIVDHDTTAQFEKVEKSLIAKEMQKEGTKIFVGTEFSCRIKNFEMHLIGYNFNYKDKKIVSLIKEAERLRRAKLLDKIARLEKQGFVLKEDQKSYLLSLKNVGKPHIAKCLMDNGVEGTMGHIIRHYINGGEIFKLEAKKVIDSVHGAGGFMVIAHPYQIAKENHLTSEQTTLVWEELVRLGVDGMECGYSKYSAEQINTLAKFAKRHNLLITCGSDYHGPNIKPKIKIGKVSL